MSHTCVYISTNDQTKKELCLIRSINGKNNKTKLVSYLEANRSEDITN